MGKKSKSGADFIQWFVPIIDALKDLGDSGQPSEVMDWILEHCDVPPEEVEHQYKSGQSKFYNKVAWARTYLAKAGYLGSSRRGVWELSEKGRKSNLTYEDAREIARQIATENRERLAKRAAESEETDDTPEVEEDDHADETIANGPKDHRQEVLEILREMPPGGFEKLCQLLLREAGFTQVKVTGKSGDGGIDGHGLLEVNPLISFPVYFQSKRYKGTISPSVVRDFRGAMQGRADKGLIITTGTFSRDARAEAVRDGVPPIELVDADKLIDELERLEVGLRPIKAYEVDREFFERFQ